MEEQEKTFKESTLSFARNVIVFSAGDLHLSLPWMNQALASCILTCLLPNCLPFKSSVCNLQRFGICVADLFVDGRLRSARLGSLGIQVLFKRFICLLPSVLFSVTSVFPAVSPFPSVSPSAFSFAPFVHLK